MISLPEFVKHPQAAWEDYWARAAEAREIRRKERFDEGSRKACAMMNDERYLRALDEVVIFPGSIEEYEDFRGYERGSIVACKTGVRDSQIFLRFNAKVLLDPDLREGGNPFRHVRRVINRNDTGLRDRLLSEGFEAVVRAMPVDYGDDSSFARYGLPVRKRRG